MAMLSEKSNVSDVMFQRLARNNVKKNMRHYLIYFITLLFSVSMLYTFNSIGAQFSMLNMSDRGSYLAFSSGMMASVSVFISLILGFLVVYANKFLMRRRKKELGIYITLGMRQKDISRMLVKETVIIGGLSLIWGILLGIFLSQGLSLITIKFLQIEGAQYRFVISPLAVVECLVFYSLIFFFMNWRNKKMLAKHSLVELLYADKKNEEAPDEKLAGKFFMLTASVICMAVSSIISVIDGFNMKYISASVVVLFIGTFLFFRSVAGIFLFLLHKKKRLYYKDLNMFSIHQVSSKINSTNKVLSVICLLLFLSFTTISVGLGISVSVSKGLSKMTSADAVIESYRENSGQEISVKDKLEQLGFPLEKLTSSTVEVDLYEQSDISISSFFLPGTPGKEKLLKDRYKNMDQPLYVMKISAFNDLRRQQGLEPINMDGQEFLINCDVSEISKAYEYYAEHGDAPIEINGHSLSLMKNGVYQMPYQNVNVLSDMGTLIVPDEAAEGLESFRSLLNCMYTENSEQMEEAFMDAWMELNDTGLRIATKRLIITEITSTSMTLSYIAVYLGIIFLICACAVLALQQTANAIDNTARYETLRRLGAKESSMRKTLRTQILVYFGVPLVLGLLYSVVGIRVMYTELGNVPADVIAQNVLFASVMFILVYGSYFFITYNNTKNILKLDRD